MDYAATLASIAAALPEPGWVVVPGCFSAASMHALRQQALSDWQAGAFAAAGMGKGQARMLNTEIRGDSVLWLEDGQGAVDVVQDFLFQLRQVLNRELFMGIFEDELHFAVYPPGSRYQRHIDNFRGSSARLVTFILYLNQDWQPGDGGELRLYTEGEGGACVDIPPVGGQLVVFLSERFYHEVLPTRRERLSLTGWLRRRG